MNGTSGPKNELDKDAFLKLLVAQLRNQDPHRPMDTSAFMAQTTQLTSVEKLSELAETTRASFASRSVLAAASLVGHQVSWTADGRHHLQRHGLRRDAARHHPAPARR